MTTIVSFLTFLFLSVIPDLGIVSGIVLTFLGVLSSLSIGIVSNNLPTNNPLSHLLQVLKADFLRRRWAYLIIPSIIVLLMVARGLPAIVTQEQSPGKLDASIDFQTYIVDNSGSMGCKYEGVAKEDGYCEVIPGARYRVDIAKDWIDKELQNPNLRLERVGLIEIGGNTLVEGKCNVNTLFDVGLRGYDELVSGLRSIKANASGATDLGGAIYRATSDILNAQDLSEVNSPNREIIFISDLGDNCGEIPLDQVVPLLEQKGYEIENINNLLKHTNVLKIGPKSRDGLFFNARHVLSRSLAAINAFPIIYANAGFSEVVELQKLGINVLKVENYESFSSLPRKNKFKENLLRFLIPITAFLITNMGILLRDLITEEESEIVSLDWSNWRANLWNQMFYGQNIPVNLGEWAEFSFIAHRDGQIDNVNITASSSEMEQIVKTRILSLQKTNALVFPKSTRRQEVEYESSVSISKPGRRARPEDFPDQEEIHPPT
ncbi:MAG: vWA domain-containing protein [Cyanobacteria bacterium P01_F01_bin.150]